MHDQKGGEGPVVQLASERAMARNLRRWLGKAGVRRPELHEGSPPRKPLTWHDLRATGITWMAVRGDDPLKIRQRAGHSTLSTTEIYIREAEAVREGFGEVFPALPGCLLDPFGSSATVSDSDSSDARAACFLVLLGGVEGTRNPSKTRDRAGSEGSTGGENGPQAASNPATSLDPLSETARRDTAIAESTNILDLKPPSAMLRAMLDGLQLKSPEDRRALLRELAQLLVAEADDGEATGTLPRRRQCPSTGAVTFCCT
jgi:hypothetical protein